MGKILGKDQLETGMRNISNAKNSLKEIYCRKFKEKEPFPKFMKILLSVPN